MDDEGIRFHTNDEDKLTVQVMMMMMMMMMTVMIEVTTAHW